MFTHARSAAVTGAGTERNSRGWAFTAATPAGTYNLLTLQADAKDLPARVSVEILNSTTLTGGGSSIVVQGINAAGTVTTIATGGTSVASVVGSYLAYGNDIIQVVFTPPATAGVGAIFVDLTGIGVLA